MGGSVSGILAAAMLSKHSNEVIILEQETVPDDATDSFVPQGKMPHLLLQRGLDIAEKLLPGTRQLISEKGGIHSDFSSGVFWHCFGGVRAKITKPTGLSNYLLTRGLLESILRSQLRTLCPNVQFQDQSKMISYIYKTEEKGHLITGVIYRNKDQKEVKLFSDLVVDCCGIRTPSLSQFKEKFGISVRKTVVRTDVQYASMLYTVPSSMIKYNYVYYMQIAPDQPYGALMYQIEGENTFMINMFGMNKHKVPKNVSALEEMLQERSHDVIYEHVRNGEPLSDINIYKKEGSQWNHFEEVENIYGFVAMGDSVVCGNPIFGQGMSMAAEASLVLDNLLREKGYDNNTCVEFHKRLSCSLTVPWIFASASDMQFKETSGGSSILRALLPLLSRMSNSKFKICAHDQDELIDFMHVLNMTDGWTLRLLLPLPVRKLLSYSLTSL
jgi:2-polyprenyl-6-methoxyphenol hydroxylase-like FAD-dependent oxidoreductase